MLEPAPFPSFHRETPRTALARAIGAARAAIDGDRPDVVELVADLLSMVPEARNRIFSLLERAVLPWDDRDAAIQVLELWDGRSREDLRKRFLV
jgi:hypothetical protein